MYTEQCENNSPPPLSSPLKGEEMRKMSPAFKGEEFKRRLSYPQGGRN